MSAPPSPRLDQTALGNVQAKTRGRPPALDLPGSSLKAASDAEIHYGHAGDAANHVQQPSFHVSPAENHQPTESEYPPSRSASATSSLDPYYFGIRSPSDSPAPPLPTNSTAKLSATPDQNQISEPVTPARDPASIDRRGLVGVGELATPRWTRSERIHEDSNQNGDLQGASDDVVAPEDIDRDEPDSPWTIEAVDGEGSEKDEVPEVQPTSRSLRARPSLTEESGGEEILYPRQTQPAPPMPKIHKSSVIIEESQSLVVSPEALSPGISVTLPTSPPTSFNASARRARKRTSDEFEMDHTGMPVSKFSGIKDKPKEDKPAVRKHRSLGVSSPASKGKERAREGSMSLSLGGSAKSRGAERHTRQTSTSSVSSGHDGHHGRRVHTVDYSHLPPSPSTSSIQQFLKSVGPNNPRTPPLTAHSSPNVAHSLLRGTQEGWSGLDDEATAEALRKLDGLTGRSARARASVASLNRPASLSRPSTPPTKSTQWEALGLSEAKISRRNSGKEPRAADREHGKEYEVQHQHLVGLGVTTENPPESGETIVSSDEQPLSSGPDKTPRKSSVRSSFTAKRGSTSSTTYTSTPTTSSRDSATMSVSTNATSVASGRHSTSKTRRNSVGSDASSVHSSDATSLKDRAASLAANGDAPEEAAVPPVPPLPKDLSNYKTPPTPSSGVSFPVLSPTDDKDGTRRSHDAAQETLSSAQQLSSGSQSKHARRQSHLVASGYSSVGSGAESAPAPVPPKTPSKKWSFTNALNLKLSGSSPSSAQKSGFPLSPRAVTFGQQLRKSTSKDQSLASAASNKPWTPTQSEAMSSAASLVSLSSVGSVRSPNTPSAGLSSKTPDRTQASSRPGTGSSASTNHTTSALAAPPSRGPLSPTSSIRRGQSQKRLTPSSIPFFRRSSSQSMQLPPIGPPSASSPTMTTAVSSAGFKSDASYNASVSTPASTHKKSSVLSLGLPALLKSSSRRSLNEAAREGQRAKDALKDAEKERVKLEKLEKERVKKEEKDRSESRISVLMGRKRGKTLSATDPRKPKSPVSLPPMQMSALEPVTAQRVARLKASSNSTSTSASSTPPAASTPRTSTARLTSQTVSSMAKQSDSSLRSNRNQLPTIAGSPSVGTINSQTVREIRDGPPSSSMNPPSSLPKETPTKIPRISSRTSTAASPTLKNSSSAFSTRRASANISALAHSSSANASPTGMSTNEFGVIENGDSQSVPNKSVSGPLRHGSVRSSPSMNSTSRVPRQVSGPPSSVSTSTLPRKSNRDSISFSSGLRKSSTGSVTSSTAPAAPAETTHHRFSALSPSRGINKLLSPKISLPTSRSSNASASQQAPMTPTSSHHSNSTPSPAPSAIDEEEFLGDEEMLEYIRRQQAKKLASGSSQEELDELLRFPEPIAPASPSSPSAMLKSSQHQYLSDYERKEILDFPSVYFTGAKSKKKPATPENSTNNYGYDDERGDYLVVYHDHLAYRYEVLDTLGKGSFGQVLSCRDHCTGESVAIKIIRNKKRFHHQALIEIKILDNLRKWDSDEKHHVIKMTEHFYFRNHLCIAMELLSINLYELIKANGFVGFTTNLIRRFTSQMLLSLSLMRHHRIVHCDLKPENVLLKHPAKSAIKVIDFGSSCFEHEKIYTYIQSRFYRSPEVILGMNYHMAIDMWSLGCILAELYTGFPIFPGENEQEQLSCIMEVLGAPDKDFINRSTRKKLFFDPNGTPRAVVNSKGRRRRPGTKTLAQVLRCNDEEFVDFIAKCLVWDPERRMKPQAALRHPFVSAGRRAKATPSSSSKGSLLSSSSRTKHLTETPKKSQISAPTPLAARSSRITGGNNGVPSTPSNSTHATTIGSSRSYRASQSQGLSSTYHSSRALSGYTATAAK